MPAHNDNALDGSGTLALKSNCVPACQLIRVEPKAWPLCIPWPAEKRTEPPWGMTVHAAKPIFLCKHTTISLACRSDREKELDPVHAGAVQRTTVRDGNHTLHARRIPHGGFRTCTESREYPVADRSCELWRAGLPALWVPGAHSQRSWARLCRYWPPVAPNRCFMLLYVRCWPSAAAPPRQRFKMPQPVCGGAITPPNRPQATPHSQALAHWRPR